MRRSPKHWFLFRKRKQVDRIVIIHNLNENKTSSFFFCQKILLMRLKRSCSKYEYFHGTMERESGSWFHKSGERELRRQRHVLSITTCKGLPLGMPWFTHEIPRHRDFTGVEWSKLLEKSRGHVLSYSRRLRDQAIYLQEGVRAYQCHRVHKIDSYPRSTHMLDFHCIQCSPTI